MLRKYGPAVELFGQPIKTRRMDLGDIEKTKVDGLNAKVNTYSYIILFSSKCDCKMKIVDFVFLCLQSMHKKSILE